MMALKKIACGLAVVGFVAGCKIVYDAIKKCNENKVNTILVFGDRCRTCGYYIEKSQSRRGDEKSCCSRALNTLIGYLDAAQHSMDLCMYIVTCPELTAATLRAHARGVTVRIILDNEMAFASKSSAFEFRDAGIPVRCKKASMMMHMKFCVLDSPQRVKELKRPRASPLAISGTFNWTAQASRGNTEVVMVTSNSNVVEHTQFTFNKLWNSFPDIVIPTKKRRSF